MAAHVRQRRCHAQASPQRPAVPETRASTAHRWPPAPRRRTLRMNRGVQTGQLPAQAVPAQQQARSGTGARAGRDGGRQILGQQFAVAPVGPAAGPHAAGTDAAPFMQRHADAVRGQAPRPAAGNASPARPCAGSHSSTRPARSRFGSHSISRTPRPDPTATCSDAHRASVAVAMPPPHPSDRASARLATLLRPSLAGPHARRPSSADPFSETPQASAGSLPRPAGPSGPARP